MSYHICKFTYFIYKKPATAILAAFFPMNVLAWVLLTVYAAPYDLNSRTANIAVIILAYVAFINVLRA